ncbi:MAG: formate-dependent phosphoribosylglycinamide formyltransferase [Burkholderiaceae bacterium]|nr:formate-dependent phosphoribosylglycinamide formyltransferase [Burkholderiaceae bacterium]MCD8517432.1 formate-dependent phosphoribosylglycinamide formyltransferase [Burkholderiaceae bacterium]MCD8536962.1 formate-dependent phosphoribosylglycinamide formyltransferase [Burkholderiaceae bacterium]
MSNPPSVSATWGTPLSPVARRVMLLGAGELGKEVVIALQRFGVEVIAVDRYAHAPAQQVAHHAEVVNMADRDALKAVIDRYKPDVIVPEIEAIATDLLVDIEGQDGLRVTPTARAARLTMNREGIRRLAAETLGLPTSPYRFADTFVDFQQAVREIGLPCVVKPVMSSSGKGQSVIRELSDVQPAWDYAQTGGRVGAGRVIVEGWVEFDYEITLLTVRYQHPQGRVATEFCAPIGHLQVDGDYVESWQPQPMSQTALTRAQEIALMVTSDLGGLGIFGVELFVKGDMVWFSEVSPRPHDTGLVTLASQVQSEFEIHARALLGLPVSVAMLGPGASRVIYGGVDAKAVVFDGMADALAEPGTDLRLFGKPESFVKRRLGVGLASADTVEQARARARAVSRAVTVRAAD